VATCHSSFVQFDKIQCDMLLLARKLEVSTYLGMHIDGDQE